MRAYRIFIKRGSRVLLDFVCMSPDSCTAACQHIDLAPAGAYVKVEAINV